MKKVIAMLLSLVVTAGSVVSCGHDEPSTDASVSTSSAVETEEISETDYKTMKPPEGGWTIEDILSVTYLCGRQLSYPLTFELLGEGFSIGESAPSGYAETIAIYLLFDGKSAGKMRYVGIDDISKWNTELPICDLMFGGIRYEADMSLTVNGVELGDSKKKLIEALGQPDEFSETGDYVYKMKDSTSDFQVTLDADENVMLVDFNDFYCSE